MSLPIPDHKLMTAPVSFYHEAPQRCVALDELEKLGHLRVKLLAQLDAQTPPNHVLNNFTGDADLVSHFALRLAFCRVQRDWDWLVSSETKLFACRLGCLPPDAAVTLLAAQGVHYELVNPKKISGFNRNQVERDDLQQSFYQVPFSEVPVLVKRRKVVLRKGFCLVPPREMSFVAVHHFRCCLEKKMRDLQCAIPAQGPELERLAPLLDGFVEKANILAGVGRGRAQQERPQLDVAEIDRVAYRHFPLCMQQLHRKLRENHHLKYEGRVQYRMFLKGAGVSVHDCIQFFRKEFIKKIAPAKFDKEYTYHIRHSYGLEGSRKDYMPLDCEQIIGGSAPSHGQYHGCPFKHWGRPALQDELRRKGLSLQCAMVITQLAATGQFQHACKAFFKATHPSGQIEVNSSNQHASGPPRRTHGEEIVMHPNIYLDASLVL